MPSLSTIARRQRRQTRQVIAQNYTKNLFVVREEMLEKLDFMLIKHDFLYLRRFLVLICGGVILTNYEPTSIVEMFKKYK